jgi:Carboxypeptidase regulatory-like domain
MRHLRFGWPVAVLLATTMLAASQRQSRDAPLPGPDAVGPSGTGSLSGVLRTAGESPRTVRRATIRLVPEDGPGTRIVGTDDDGRFHFDGLPAGRFTLSATKPGFVETFHGSARPGRGPGVPVAIADGQAIDVPLEIVPGAVITCVITDPTGRPAPGVPVAVIAAGASNVGAVPARTLTDDRGVYRVFGLAPGTWIVSALPALDTRGGGRATAAGISSVTDEEVRWARASRSGGANGPPPDTGRPVTYAPVFYPGTTDATAAETIRLATGEARDGVGFALRVVPTAQVSGTLVDETGQPVTAVVMLYPRRRDRPSAADRLVESGALRPPRAVSTGNAFSLSGVVPGDYTLVAQSGSGTRRTTAAEAAGPAPPTRWNVTDITIDGRDETGLLLRLAPGLHVSGSILFEHAALTPPTDLGGADLSLVASGSSLGTASTPHARVAPDGTFTFSSIVPWTYTLRAVLPGAAAGGAWMLKSAMLDGRDLADGAFDVRADSGVAGLVITFTDRAAGITGRLVDAAGRAVTRYSVVVFPADRALWLPGSRRVRSARPATDGSFAIGGLPEGRYSLAAAEDVEDVDLSDPTFLEQLLAASVPLTVAEGQQVRQDLRVGG